MSVVLMENMNIKFAYITIFPATTLYWLDGTPFDSTTDPDNLPYKYFFDPNTHCTILRVCEIYMLCFCCKCTIWIVVTNQTKMCFVLRIPIRILWAILCNTKTWQTNFSKCWEFMNVLFSSKGFPWWSIASDSTWQNMVFVASIIKTFSY